MLSLIDVFKIVMDSYQGKIDIIFIESEENKKAYKEIYNKIKGNITEEKIKKFHNLCLISAYLSSVFPKYFKKTSSSVGDTGNAFSPGHSSLTTLSLYPFSVGITLPTE